ncbi:MAG: type II toxin-antitoxin system VapC family toxin [Anaerolineae bacterium]
MTRRVIDANIAIALALRYPYSAAASQRLMTWHDDGDELFVPSLWQYEVVSVLRKAVAAKMLSAADALEALDAIFVLQFTEVSPSLDTHRLALAWADRLNHAAAYDAQYLAAAEQLGAELWTADRRLVQRAQQLGVQWVRHVED